MPKDLIESVIAKNEETVNKLLQKSVKEVKSTARKSFSGYRKDHEDDKVIDWVADTEDDEISFVDLGTVPKKS